MGWADTTGALIRESCSCQQLRPSLTVIHLHPADKYGLLTSLHLQIQTFSLHRSTFGNVHSKIFFVTFTERNILTSEY